MAIDLADYQTRTRDAVKMFWRSRDRARRKHADTRLPDQGERASVTTGKNMDGFICRRLVREQLYTTAAVVSSPRSAAQTGEHGSLSAMTGLKTFVTSLAGHLAAEAAKA